MVSASTVADTTLGYARSKWFLGRITGVPDVAAEIGIKNTPPIGGGPIFAGSGFNLNQPAQTFLDATENLYQLGQDATHVRGRHSLKFGGQLINRRLYYPRDPNNKGQFTFTRRYSNACPAGRADCTAALRATGRDDGGLPFADFLLGTASNVLFQQNSAPYHAHRLYGGLYVQDSWRATTRLTVNIGLRYEHWTPWHMLRNTAFSYDENTGAVRYVLQNPLDYLDPAKGHGRTAPLNTGVPRDGYRPSRADFAPRAGLAFAIRPGTVFRAGYGIYYDANVNMNQFTDLHSGIAPFFLRHEVATSAGEQVPSLVVDGNFPVPGPTTIPFPNANPPFSFRFTKPFYPASSVQEWSASLQHRIGADWAVDLNYTGTHAIHLQQFIDANSAALPQGPLASLPLQSRRPQPQWGVLGTWAPIGWGRYNGASVSFKNNTWKRLTLISSFTFAKNLVSSNLGNSDQGNTNHRVPYLWAGPARLTPRLRWVSTYSYDLPVGRGSVWNPSSRALSSVVSGWTFSGIIDLTTGAWNAVTTNDLTGTGLAGSAHPDRICDARNVPGGRSYLQWFNTACFTQPAFGIWGNSAFGAFEDPGIANWNMALAKSVALPQITEASRIEFRADLFNALNHTQWGSAAAVTVQSGNVNAGRISSTRPPRQMQFSLRMFF
ncbi:MAG: hypothetical protein FJW39_32230 [Acidobacteria bacterium]|nr:hypothetical protein [Acidobacteriota bacterium]